MSVLAKKRSDRGRLSAFHMTCPGTEDVFVNPLSCQFSLFTKGINHLLLFSPLTPDPPARPPLCCPEEAGKQFRLRGAASARPPPRLAAAVQGWGLPQWDPPPPAPVSPSSWLGVGGGWGGVLGAAPLGPKPLNEGMKAP